MSNNKIDSQEMTLMSEIKSSQLKNCIESDNRRRTFTSTKYWIRDNVESAYPHKIEVIEKNERIEILEAEVKFFHKAFSLSFFAFGLYVLYRVASIWLQN